MELRQGVALWRLEQGKANAMSRPMLDELERRLDELEGSAATAAVITGYDRFFSAGLALPTLLGLPREAMRRFIERFNEIMLREIEIGDLVTTNRTANQSSPARSSAMKGS